MIVCILFLSLSYVVSTTIHISCIRSALLFFCFKLAVCTHKECVVLPLFVDFLLDLIDCCILLYLKAQM